jgi:Mor family transcriptional regulator
MGYGSKKNTPIPKIFDEKTVEQIRIDHSFVCCSYRTLAYIYNCSHSTIEHIIRRKGAYALTSRSRD